MQKYANSPVDWKLGEDFEDEVATQVAEQDVAKRDDPSASAVFLAAFLTGNTIKIAMGRHSTKPLPSTFGQVNGTEEDLQSSGEFSTRAFDTPALDTRLAVARHADARHADGKGLTESRP